MRIAIVGAGIAGMSCAEALRPGGHAVSLFDKGRGPGGRMATRRVPTASGAIMFDHGAQYFTARDPVFAGAVEGWRAKGVVARWPCAGPHAWVGTPRMSAVPKAMSAPLTVHQNLRVEAIRSDHPSWFLDHVAEDAFDAVIIATPAEQAGPLLMGHDPAMAAIAQACRSDPCWTAMVAYASPIAIAQDVVRDTGIIGWAARNSAKPGRGGAEAWVVQGTARWSRDHLEDAETGVVDALLDALARQASAPLPDAEIRVGHRWRYARADRARHGCLWNERLRLGVVGDWLVAPRIEGAWLSGRLLADRILAGRP